MIAAAQAFVLLLRTHCLLLLIDLRTLFVSKINDSICFLVVVVSLVCAGTCFSQSNRL